MAEKGPMIPIVSSSFCYPEPKDLEITKKIVKDANGNLIFQVKKKKILVDAAGLPILKLRKKTWSMHNRWEVFRGDSKDEKDLIFTARRSSTFQMKDKIHVFLANNKSENVCDYLIQGNWFGGSCKVYAGDSTTIIAQMEKKTRFFGKDKLMVRVYPHTDQAFIVALILIFEVITTSSGGGGGIDGGGGGGGGCGGGGCGGGG